MGRNVYFSFHYQDVIDFRANVVRNSGKFRQKGDSFRDGSIWEEAKEKQVNAIKSLITSELSGKSVTCVLIGSETYSRRWVRYEIMKSFESNKGLLGVGINWIKDKHQRTKFWPGENPFEYLGLVVSNDGKTIELFEIKDNKWVKYKDLPKINNNHFKERYYGKEMTLSELYNKYSYNWNNGSDNLTNWIETAAKNAGR
jgi:hypothetical protein